MFLQGVTTPEQTEISQGTLDIISQNLANLGALSFEQYLDGDDSVPPIHTLESPPSPPTLVPDEGPSPSQAPAKPIETVDANAITRLHQACQRTFRSTDALRFEIIEQNGSRNKQCILTITKPDGVKRSYATQPVFAKKNEAKAEAARIAIEMGALDFLDGGRDTAKPKCGTIVAAVSETAESIASTEPSAIDEIENCCVEWRAGRVSPHWIAFFEAKLGHKQGCALQIQLSPHVIRVYLSASAFDSLTEAKRACAKAAVSEGVLDFIKHGNGQTRPASPTPLFSSATTELGPEAHTKTPWTLQKFYDSLPRPFPESFDTNDASEINAPGWLNTMVQNARGGKLMMSFFFTSGSTPGLHGCLLKLDRPEDYRAYLVDARFPKRSDAKAAVCLQAMFQGVGDYIRSITAAVESRVTPAMRSFSSSLVYPTLTSELNKIADDLLPRFEYDRERDAFGATLVVKLPTAPPLEQVRSYHVPCDYRNKADAKVAVICRAAEQGVVEFVRFRGASLPPGYVSPYMIHQYDPEASRKRKQSGAEAELDEDAPVRKKRKDRRREVESQKGSSSHGSHQHRTHGVPGPGDIGLMQGIHPSYPSDQSQLGYGNESGSGAASYSYGHSYGPPKPSLPNPRFASLGHGQGSALVYGVHEPSVVYDSSKLLPDQGPSHTRPSAVATAPRHSVEQDDLEPGEVLSSAESEFSGLSSRGRTEQVHGTYSTKSGGKKGSRKMRIAPASSGHDSKAKCTPATVTNTATISIQDGRPEYTSHMRRLIDYCVQERREAPTFHQARKKSDDKFEAWIVIGKERFDLPRTYAIPEEGWQRVAKQILARLSKQEAKD